VCTSSKTVISWCSSNAMTCKRDSAKFPVKIITGERMEKFSRSYFSGHDTGSSYVEVQEFFLSSGH